MHVANFICKASLATAFQKSHSVPNSYYLLFLLSSFKNVFLKIYFKITHIGACRA